MYNARKTFTWPVKERNTEKTGKFISFFGAEVEKFAVNPVGMLPGWFKPQSEQRMNLLVVTDSSYEKKTKNFSLNFPPKF